MQNIIPAELQDVHNLENLIEPAQLSWVAGN